MDRLKRQVKKTGKKVRQKDRQKPEITKNFVICKKIKPDGKFIPSSLKQVKRLFRTFQESLSGPRLQNGNKNV